MKKSTRSLSLVVSIIVPFLFSAAAVAEHEPRSFDMKLSGVNGQAPNPNTSLALRKMIGQFVQDLDVKTFVQLPPPATGGFHVCIEPSEPNGYDHIVYALQSISAGSSSHWDVTLVADCRMR